MIGESGSNMKVVILCGGRGTRLKEHTEWLPKPLIEIGGRPMLWHIMKIYASHGYRKFILCLGYKAQMIRDTFCGLGEDWDIQFVSTGDETPTGGRVKKIESMIQEPSFLLTYGDGVADLNIRGLVDYHHAHGKIGTVTAAKPPLQFGFLEMNGDGQVKNFREKPLSEQWINGGFFVFRREFFDYLDENSILEKEPLESLAKKGELMAHFHESFWQCMDTYKDTLVLNEVWKGGGAPWKVWL